jgi:hypothetical protein
MAKSRVNSKNKLSKKSKSNAPKWLIAGVLVLVVAVAGYAIVRFSQASTGRYLSRTVMNGGLKGGVQTVTKTENRTQNREVGNVPVYATFSSNEIRNYNKACANIYASNNTNYTLQLIGSYANNGTLPAKPVIYYRENDGSWRNVCVTITQAYKDQMLYVVNTIGPVTSTLKVIESNPAASYSYASVNSIYLTN